MTLQRYGWTLEPLDNTDWDVYAPALVAYTEEGNTLYFSAWSQDWFLFDADKKMYRIVQAAQAPAPSAMFGRITHQENAANV